MYSCPCCELTAEEAQDLRFHLLTNHRKSELTDAIMTEFANVDSRADEGERLAASV